MRLVVAALLATAAAAGCHGQIGDDAAGDGTGASPATPGDMRGGAGAQGSSPATGGSKPGTGSTPLPAGALDPGHVTLRRLNRAEYCNTVRDLLGTQLRPCDNFPQDGVLDKFDTVGAALSTSPLHTEMYEKAATDLVAEVVGAPATDPRRTRIFVCDPKDATYSKMAAGDAACARAILKAFGRRAWRRPVTDDDVAPYAGLLDDVKKQGDGFPQAIQLALQGMLMSPNFLFQIEQEPDPKAGVRALTDHELASRLSYGLWSSMPDDVLFAAADAGKLTGDAAEVGRQLDRMLGDAKAAALVTDFGGQWLTTRELPSHQVDAKTYPKFDTALRDAMAEEGRRFVDGWIRGARPLAEVLTADYTFVNDRLAAHYGLPGMGTDWRRVDLGSTQRRGILGEAAVLTVTSHADATSPTRRGSWVLDQMLCSKLPDPPPGVPPLPAAAKGQETLKQRLARHRTDPACAGCHAQMDPIGLGLEGFDAIGATRTMDNGGVIDASGVLPDGTMFSGAAELTRLLVADPRFAGCVTRRLATFLIGRTFDQVDDDRWLTRMTDDAQKAGGTVRALLATITGSAAFRTAGIERSKP